LALATACAIAAIDFAARAAGPVAVLMAIVPIRCAAKQEPRLKECISGNAAPDCALVAILIAIVAGAGRVLRRELARAIVGNLAQLARGGLQLLIPERIRRVQILFADASAIGDAGYLPSSASHHDVPRSPKRWAIGDLKAPRRT
jgi:hypothetical protein